MAKSKSKQSRARKGMTETDATRVKAIASLAATSNVLQIAAGVFLALQDDNASAAADVEEAMELTKEEREERIRRLTAELEKATKELDELNEDLPANETTAKAKERNVAEIERLLNALKIAQMVADAFPEGKNADEWRALLQKAIFNGQLDAFDLVLTILALPEVGLSLFRGLASIRTIRSFFSWLFRSAPPKGLPKRIRWEEYAAGYARRLDELKRVIAKEGRDPEEFERAAGRLREWVEEFAPESVGPPGF